VGVDVAPAVTARLHAQDAGLVVPVAVAPALLLGMGEPAVKLDGELVLLVVRVPVDHLAVDDDADLMPGSRQAVGALDVAQVPVFQDRVDAVALVTQPQASSNVRESSARSRTVSSTVVRGGFRFGCLAWLMRRERRTTRPGVVGRLVDGTVRWIAWDGESMSPCSSAAV
jgi:hypothetical protein